MFYNLTLYDRFKIEYDIIILMKINIGKVLSNILWNSYIM